MRVTTLEYRAQRVQALARVHKMRRLGLVGGVDNADGSITLWREDLHGEVVPDRVDLQAGEASYRAAEERNDLPW